MRLLVSRIFRHEILVHRPVQFVVIRNSHKVPPVQVGWEKPESGWIKLNFDGSCKCKSGRSSIGGVFRDHNAEFLLGYSEFIGKSNSTIAEIIALRRGLELVLENGWGDNSVWLEGDSKSLVDIIGKRKQLVNRCGEVQKHVTHINSIISELNNQCILTHVFREGNRAADKFAQMGYHFKNPQVWRHVPPNELLRIVHEDAEGKTFLRRR
ncbi:hypothetical protein LIER_25601 [Lithospermum erythrorhizon]|uniref:RNase H type-1 domain-containing protein n=1 Tax=Lithospermum erythrorhizon TaxID=34254 RepID=A0AAV3R7G8_LITER